MLAKLAAGRLHDFAFVETAVRSGLVDSDQLELGVDLIPPSHPELVRQRLSDILVRTRA